MKLSALSSALFISICLSAPLIHAEELPSLAEKKGSWRFSMADPGPDLKSVPKERQKKTRGLLQEVTKLVTATPAMSPPQGFEARFWGTMTAKDRYDACTGKKCPPSRPTATLAMMLGRYEESSGKAKAAFNKPSTMDISLNNLGHVFANLPVLYKDTEGYLLPQPQRDGERAGFPAYMNNGHAVAVITGSSNPLWQPVSRERYLKAAIEKLSRDAGLSPLPESKGKKKPLEEVSPINGMPVIVEETRTWIDPVEEKKWVESSRTLTSKPKEPLDALKARLATLNAELAAMPPEQRLLQARVDLATATDGQSPTLLPADSSTGTPIVTPDFAYFNPKLPGEAIQIIVIQWKFDGESIYDPDKSGIPDTLNNRKLLEIYKAMDWQKLSSKVIRTAP